MSDMFGAPPPADSPPKPARRNPAGAAKTRRPAAEPQAIQVVQSEQPPAPPEQPEPSPPRLYGPVMLIDGRVVDSGSSEWRYESLARAILGLSGQQQQEFLDGQADAVELRLLMRAIRRAE
jgi:hypothetical protein